ncbi:MAG: hypothetical protein U0R80_10095 [Nocardioidaceae bacterium]
MFELHHTEVHGVRCFWVETGRPTLAAQLLFRTGMVDESLTESGWLHLLEHLALHGRGGGALQVNGSVSLLHTAFEAHGPAEAVADHLRDVSGWLSRPTFLEFERERGVLHAESAFRPASQVTRALAWRYGARGPGIASHNDAGLGRATPELLSARAASVFTRGNAVLVLDGPPPAGLSLTLPGGELLPPPVSQPVETDVPAAYLEEGGLVLSGLVDRSATATLVPELVERALKERLREHAGAAYAPWGLYERVDDHTAVVIGGSDVLPTLLPTLAGHALDVIDRMQAQPIPEAWLSEMLGAREQGMLDPYAGPGVAMHAAHAVLRGEEPKTHAALLDEVRNTDPHDVHRSLTHFCQSLMLGLPSGTAWRDQLRQVVHPERAPSREGHRFRHRSWPATTAHMRVTSVGLEVSDRDVARAVDLDRLAGLMVFDDGVRRLEDIDGWGVNVVPDEWHDGPRLVSMVDQLVPKDLHLPQPARFDPPAYVRPGPWQRWKPAVRRGWLAAWPVTRIVLVVLIMASLFLAAVMLQMPALSLLSALLIGRIVRWVSARASTSRPDDRAG